MNFGLEFFQFLGMFLRDWFPLITTTLPFLVITTISASLWLFVLTLLLQDILDCTLRL